ncbi:GTPase subunit of restriction endonuclease-like protein [Caballeronia calidae]|uniref:GTPase subunit of restriction endonuclease-like protein n=1 Tax=Caballeronia calidae TaxID=1777139 RepID=A0A158DYY5_9BURK|nr:AAA family ATPase [Caballeronia calidae]SAK99829.1 GTPase subunit of restriction endonuclease-like protein [Caballeronia calidae]
MAAELDQALWHAALALLDANFHFRSVLGTSPPRRSYRLEPNAPPINIVFKDGVIAIEMALIVPELSHRRLTLDLGGALSHRYRIVELADLELAIKRMTGRLSPSASSTSQSVTTESAPERSMKAPTNTILYGPPGTGKTYRTAEMAVAVCEGSAGLSREAIMARYEALRVEGRISFVTFHQSYGYEDFVEGLRPNVGNGGQISYDIQPGVFRMVADAARLNTVVRSGLQGAPLKERTVYKMSLGAVGWAKSSAMFNACIEKGYVLLGWGKDIDFSECDSEAQVRERVREEWPDDKRIKSHTRFVNVFKNEVRVGDLIIVSKGNSAFRAIGEVTGEYEFLEEGVFGNHQMRPVRWLAVLDKEHDVSEIYDRSFSMPALYQLNSSFIKTEALDALLQAQRTASNLPYVLIIDEINRANISKVFGELITLLEPDKREGALNAVTVRLPYSGDDFSVPSNLHIIGTMNTADRSIALLDTALRRRFEFEELQPDYARLSERVIAGINLGTLLAALNERVEFLYDRDHTIGHAYLLDAVSLGDLDRAFRRKIIPLLQEYFHEDWAKVRLVLNDTSGGFIEASKWLPKGMSEEGDDVEMRTRYRVNPDPFGLPSYLNIYS